MSKAKQFLLEATALTDIEKVHVVPQRLTELKLFFIRNFRILNSRASFSLSLGAMKDVCSLAFLGHVQS